jgi:uncharacterized membrane protein
VWIVLRSWRTLSVIGLFSLDSYFENVSLVYNDSEFRLDWAGCKNLALWCFIVISNPLAVFFVLAAVVYVSLRLEGRFKVFRSLGAALVGILFAMVLSNLGVISDGSPTYDFLVGPGVSAGVALILLSVDVRSIRQAGPKMLYAFGVGALGTATGSIIFALLLAPIVGPETWKLSGQFTGTYTGGGLNFAALGQALGTSSDLFTAAVAADVIVTAIWMIACLSVPVLLGRGTGSSRQEKTKDDSPADSKPPTLERSLYDSGRTVPISHVAALVAITVGALLCANQLASIFSFFPKILWLTTVVLIVAQIPAVKRLAGSAMLGNYLLLLFLASNGAMSVIANIIRIGPGVFYYAAGTVAMHGIVIFGLGRLLRIDLATLAVASQANVGGPASAMAMASARGYADRILPGVAVGLSGYAIGNYLGLAVAQLVKSLLAG